VVDPRESETASSADIHLPIKPGSDGTLILNMLHVLVREGLWDKSFVEKWVHGSHGLFNAVTGEAFSPESGAPVTGIGSDLVRYVTRLYAETKPACIFSGNGLEHHPSGVNTMSLLATLKAICGNLDIPGGDLFTPRPRLKDMTAPLSEPSVPSVGSERFPVFCRTRREAQALCLPEAILKETPYPVKGMVIAGGNPTLQWPDSKRTRDALQALSFLMVIDVVQSPDCQYAHVVLPACSFLERDEHRANVYQNLSCVSLRRKVIDPVHGLPDQMIWVALARSMGFGEYFPWKTCADGINELLGGLGITRDDLISGGGIHEYESRRFKKYEETGFRTPSGKVEIHPELLRNLGGDLQSVGSQANEGAKGVENYPLFLTTGGNLLCYTHWQFRHIPRLRKMAPEPMCEIHPSTATQYGLTEGEWVAVQTKVGTISLKTRLSKHIRRDTIHIPQGWEEANVNLLTDASEVDPISGFPNLKSLRCELRKMRNPSLA
jgi:anaerobic selenocysteine-containing dehydrogenase